MNQMDRHTAATLGQETVSILRSGGYTASSGRHIDLSAALDACRAATVEYPPSRQSPLPTAGTADTQIGVENDTVLAVGRRMAASGAVAALNFAAATSPGGGFLSGARAQEESIARSSGLFLSLDGRDMYAFHRVRRDAMYTDYVIYSPSVPVFRTDAGDLLEEPWDLSIVTCPAVNGSALARHAPERLAGVQGVMLVGPFRGVFDEIVFAVTDWSPEQRFIGPFHRTFDGATG